LKTHIHQYFIAIRY